jgi:hypothetical protein
MKLKKNHFKRSVTIKKKVKKNNLKNKRGGINQYLNRKNK